MVQGTIDNITNNQVPGGRAQEVQTHDYYKQLQQQLTEKAESNRGLWMRGTDTKGKTTYTIDVTTLSSQADFTQVATHEQSVKAPMVIKALGYKIDIQKQSANLIETYIKSWTQSKSHNLLMAKLGEVKTASLGHLLSMLGLTSEDIKKLQKRALSLAVNENKALFEENLYNMELLEIIGAGGRKGKPQKIVLEEVQKQIMTQARRLGIGEMYTQDRVLELKIKVAQDIYFKFKEEEANLKYELEYLS
jgi:hypothetical protein